MSNNWHITIRHKSTIEKINCTNIFSQLHLDLYVSKRIYIYTMMDNHDIDIYQLAFIWNQVVNWENYSICNKVNLLAPSWWSAWATWLAENEGCWIMIMRQRFFSHRAHYSHRLERMWQMWLMTPRIYSNYIVIRYWIIHFSFLLKPSLSVLIDAHSRSKWFSNYIY